MKDFLKENWFLVVLVLALIVTLLSEGGGCHFYLQIGSAPSTQQAR